MTSVDAIIERLGATRTCDAGLTKDPWAFDTTKPSYGPGASALDMIPRNAPRQQPLGKEYTEASDEELQERMRSALLACLIDRMREVNRIVAAQGAPCVQSSSSLSSSSGDQALELVPL